MNGQDRLEKLDSNLVLQVYDKILKISPTKSNIRKEYSKFPNSSQLCPRLILVVENPPPRKNGAMK